MTDGDMNWVIDTVCGYCTGLIFITCIYLFVYVLGVALQHACEMDRTACRNRFSTSPMSVLGNQAWVLRLGTSAFTH